jgi:alpha-L-fucosidase 2
MPQQKAATHKFYNLPGVKYAMCQDPLGREIGGYITTMVWPCCSAWICENFINHWKFTRDKKFLKEVAWPVLYESSQFLLAYLSLRKDGLLHIAPTNMPELWLDGIDAWGSDSPMDLALIHELFSATIEAANVLKTERVFATELAEALEKLAPFPMDRETGIKVLREKQYHLPFLYTTFMLFPANLPEIMKDTKIYNSVRKTFRRVAVGDLSAASCWAMVIAAQAARLNDAKTVWRLLKSWGGTGASSSTHMTITDDWLNKSNSLMNWRGKSILQIDGTTAYPAAVNEAMVQSCNRRIKLFAAVPTNFSGAFHSLRTENGFLVSASMVDGKVKGVVIKSLLGGLCEIEHKQMVRCHRVQQLMPEKWAIVPQCSQNLIGFDSKAGHIYKMVF